MTCRRAYGRSGRDPDSPFSRLIDDFPHTCMQRNRAGCRQHRRTSAWPTPGNPDGSRRPQAAMRRASVIRDAPAVILHGHDRFRLHSMKTLSTIRSAAWSPDPDADRTSSGLCPAGQARDILKGPVTGMPHRAASEARGVDERWGKAVSSHRAWVDVADPGVSLLQRRAEGYP